MRKDSVFRKIGILKTAIDIPDAVLEETLRNTGAVTKRDAVVSALESFNKQQRLKKLVAMMGQSDTFMTHEELMADRQADMPRTCE